MRNDYTRILLSHEHVSVIPPTVALSNGKVRVGNLAEFSFKIYLHVEVIYLHHDKF